MLCEQRNGPHSAGTLAPQSGEIRNQTGEDGGGDVVGVQTSFKERAMLNKTLRRSQICNQVWYPAVNRPRTQLTHVQPLVFHGAEACVNPRPTFRLSRTI